MVDTIFALSSGHPPSGIAVIRISGDGTREAVLALCPAGLPSPRALMRRKLVSPSEGGAPLDEGMVVWTPAPATFTGEDYAELHVHGGRAVVAAILESMAALPGCRMAEPGEFSRRAFDNGKLDLSAAEGLADLIASDTETQRKQALRQLSGHLAQQCLSWQQMLMGALAHMEASIDFSDEDLPDDLDGGARRVICAVSDEIAQCLDDANAGERIRDGVRIAIVGPPNVGKSSLLNMLSGREAAITSEHAGTTRDVIEVSMEIDGFAVTLSDTAGLRESVDCIEQEGVRRAEQTADAADIRLVLFDGEKWPNLDAASIKWMNAGSLGVLNKSDLLIGAEPVEAQGMQLVSISVKNGTGIDVLLEKLCHELEERWGVGEGAIITRHRHREALHDCHGHLLRTLEAQGSELWAEDLRLAMRSLGRIVGQVGVEEVLDAIFSEFCIGK